jgi:hypothetical protein
MSLSQAAKLAAKTTLAATKALLPRNRQARLQFINILLLHDEASGRRCSLSSVGAVSRWADVIFAARMLTEADSKDVQEWMLRTNFENMRDWFSFLDIEQSE